MDSKSETTQPKETPPSAETEALTDAGKARMQGLKAAIEQADKNKESALIQAQFALEGERYEDAEAFIQIASEADEEAAKMHLEQFQEQPSEALLEPKAEQPTSKAVTIHPQQGIELEPTPEREPQTILIPQEPGQNVPQEQEEDGNVEAE